MLVSAKTSFQVEYTLKQCGEAVHEGYFSLNASDNAEAVKLAAERVAEALSNKWAGCDGADISIHAG
jgi:hypothetical protein